MVRRIFVSYRREDSRADARSLRDRLAQAFGEKNVFMDVDELKPGQRFDVELTKSLSKCDVFLCVIGQRWLEILKQRAVLNERDYVRQEIASALDRNLLFVPVLVERTTMPRADDLPEDIRGLLLHQAHGITHDRFGRDVRDLIEAIGVAHHSLRPQVLLRRAKGGGFTAILGALVLVAAAMYLPSAYMAPPGESVAKQTEEERVRLTTTKVLAELQRARDEDERRRAEEEKRQIEERRALAAAAESEAVEERRRVQALIARREAEEREARERSRREKLSKVHEAYARAAASNAKGQLTALQLKELQRALVERKCMLDDDVKDAWTPKASEALKLFAENVELQALASGVADTASYVLLMDTGLDVFCVPPVRRRPPDGPRLPGIVPGG